MSATNVTSNDDQQEAHGAFTPLTNAAQQRARRFGAPLAVVDPLLSFLFDLHRLQESVIAELGRMGVSRGELPPPFGDAQRAPHSSGAASARGQHHDTHVDHLAHYATLGTSDAQDTLSPHTTRVQTVDAVLRWLAQVDGATAKTEAGTAENSHAAAGRRLLTALVVNTQEAGAGQPCIVVEGDAGDGTAQAPAKRARHESAVHFRRGDGDMSGRAEATALPPRDESAMELVGCYSEAEMRHFVEQWAGYDDALKCTLRTLRHLLHAVCASSIAGSLSSHAKCVEVDAAEVQGASRPAVPACETIVRNYDRLTELSDDLATCQLAVHKAFVALEAVVEQYYTEAEVVARREAEYWEQVRVLECEFHALTQLRASVHRIERDVRRMCNTDAKTTTTAIAVVGKDVDADGRRGDECAEGNRSS